ncbi:MAG: TlyA family RNA methyltransferase [SAR202 cluster bacterium]|nr:TlyA family RNA methyltransferase [SAR202 cluster bacterium]|tara:strand:+ start:2836 stop:3594 length:759 start_codon:yes stop_codon:yes gene_type:complete
MAGFMHSKSRIRLDQLLVDHGLAFDVKEAGALVMAGEVELPGDRRSPTPGMQVDISAKVLTKPVKRFVSRGGDKLVQALNGFDVEANGAVCLDVGASTGGFTDCLLQAGATRVYAVDTGRGQLHHRLLNDKRVISIERTNVVDLKSPSDPIDLAVVDVSFTSLEIVLPAILELLSQKGQVIVLLKPQFEATRSEVPRGGVILDPMVHAVIIGRFLKWIVDRNIRVRNFLSSGVLGDKGNREFFLHIEPAAVG